MGFLHMSSLVMRDNEVLRGLVIDLLSINRNYSFSLQINSGKYSSTNNRYLYST